MPQAIGIALLKIGFFVVELAAGAAAAAGLGAASAVAIGAAVVVGGAIIAKQAMSLFEIEMPTVDTDASRQRTIKSTTEPQKIIYGEALVSGPISFIGLAGTDNSDLYQTIVLAGHELTDITDIHMDDVVITDAQINSGSNAGGNVTAGTFGPKESTTICTINKYLGLTSQTADSLLTNAFTNYTSAHRGDGIAYLSMKWVLNDDSAETWDKFAPSNVKALVKGKPVYDPRLDTGAPNYNPLNQLFITYNATSGSYVGQGQNPSLVLADYLISDLGMGISPSKIDWSSFITAANGCDASVSVPGGTEKRFTCNGVLFATDSHQKNINKILSSMNGNLVYSNGKYIVHAGIYEAHSESLNEDDLIGAISIKTSLERSDRFNTIKGLFVDPAQNHKSSEFPKVQLTDAVTRDNDEVLEKEVQYPMTNSSYMAQRLSHKLIQLSDQQKVITFPANLSALRITAGDRVQVSIEELNWTNKIFQCAGWTFSEEGGVNLTLREDSWTSYADPAVNQYSTVTATGDITDAFRGVPSPSGLRAASGEKKVFLNWVNPGKPSDFGTIEIYASASNNIANAVKIGETDGTQFVHDGNNAADQIAVGNTRVYWVRSKKNVGTDSSAVSVYQPNSSTGVGPVTVLATLVDWDNVANPTIGIDINNDTISINTGVANTTTGQTVATSGIEAGTTVTQGGITMNQGGSIKGGQSAYNSGTGFFLGYDTNAYKFSIGNSSTEALTFDGTNLAVTGTVNASAGDFTGDVSTDSKFIAGLGNATTVIDGNDSAEYRIFSGAAESQSEKAPFKVRPDGSVFAKNITVYDASGNILLDQSGLGAAALAGISLTSGSAVDKVSGVLAGDSGETTLTLDQTATVTLTSKVAIYDNSAASLYFYGAGASESAALANLTAATLNVIYSLKTDSGSYSAAATKPITFTSTDSTPSSTEIYITANLISGQYETFLMDAGGALQYIANTSTYGATAYVVTSHTFTNLPAGVHKFKLSTSVNGGSPTAAGLAASDRLYELASADINFVESAVNVFANGTASVPSGINVKEYGATGDGSTDDTSAINSAISSLTTGGTLIFPKGTYKISSAVAFDGKEATVQAYGATFTLVGNNAGFHVKGTINNFNVFGGTINGDNDATRSDASTAQIGWLIGDAVGATINNVTIRDVKVNQANVGFKASYGGGSSPTVAFNVRFINCQAIDSAGTTGGVGYGFQFAQVSGGMMDNCLAADCTRHGIYLSEGADYTISNCYVKDGGIGSGVVRGAVAIARSNNVTVTGCSIDNANDVGMVIDDDDQGLSPDNYSKNITISGCTFKANVLGGIWVGENLASPNTPTGLVENLIINACTFHSYPSTTSSEIRINSGKNIILSNSVLDATNAGSTHTIVALINTGGSAYTDNVSLIGNQFVGVKNRAVELAVGLATNNVDLRFSQNSGISYLWTDGAPNATNDAVYTDDLGVIPISGATPKIGAGNRFLLSQTGSTSVTNFLGGREGKRISVQFADGNSTLTTATVLSGNQAYAASNNDQITLEYRDTGWREITRQSQTGLDVNVIYGGTY